MTGFQGGTLPDEGLLLVGGLAAAALSKPISRFPAGGANPVEAGAEEGALPWHDGNPYWRTMTVSGAPALAPEPVSDQALGPRLVRSLLENTRGLVVGIHTCRTKLSCIQRLSASEDRPN